MPESMLIHRALRAAQDLQEALSVNVAPAPAAAPAPGPGGAPAAPLPPQLAPRGALQMAPGATPPPPSQGPSPLQGLGSFKSPPLQAALQGAVGRAGGNPLGDSGFGVRG